jgi:hypothetical protein
MGVDIKVDDLDLIFYTPDIALVNEAFKEYIVEPIVSTEGTPRSGTFKYYGVVYSYCRTCFMFEPFDSVDNPEPTHFGQYAIKNLETINWNGYSIKVAPLDLHLKTYERWGSKQTAQKIKEYLQKSR